MEQNEWIDHCKQIERYSHDYPQIKGFFRLVMSLFFLFPHLNSELLSNRNEFVNQICHKADFWEINWLKTFFQFEANLMMSEFLLKEDWWWDFLKQIEDDPVKLYTLSAFHESLGTQKKRKTSGLFFTPKNQIKLICYYTLFFFLRDKINSDLDDKTLHKIVFKKKYPLDVRIEDCHQITHILTSSKILDPSCGTGIFLVEMIQLIISILIANPVYENKSTVEKLKITQGIFSRLFGYDIDSDNVKLAKIILTQQYLQSTAYSEKEISTFVDKKLQIYEKDFISEKRSSLPKFDIIVGNPPYIRHHWLNTKSFKGLEGKSVFIQDLRSFFPKISFKWDKKADLYVYFWLKAIMHLNNRGVISFVLSRAWFSSRYATPLKHFFSSYFNLDLIIELPFEVWESAEIRTHIILGHKVENLSKPKTMRFIVWNSSVKSLLEAERSLLDINELEVIILDYKDQNLEIKAVEKDQYRCTQVLDLIPFLTNSRKLFPILRLDYLLMSPFLLNLLIEKKGYFCLLKEIGKLGMGSTTGANRFFYLDKETINDYNIPKENMYLMTKSPKEWQTIFSPIKENMKYLLYISEKLSESSSDNLHHYINSIQNILLKRPYFKNKTIDNWYQIPLIVPDILFPNMTYKRSFVAYNRDKLHIDKQWIGFWANNREWVFFLLGFFNSTLGILLREIQGTRTLGLGSLKLSLQECQNLLVLDPRKMSKEIIKRFQSPVKVLGNLRIDSLNELDNLDSEYSKIQEELDQLILVECLQLTPADIIKIREILKFEINWRLAKEKR
ncbi:MAG: Eco57I restriction-modification methylase domain-containing protein [Promethearchaeota archaeon]